MSLSPVAFFGLLDENNPVGTDSRRISDDQHRNILASMKQQAPNWTAAITAAHGDVNLLTGYAAAGKKPMPGDPLTTKLWFYANTVPTGWTLANPDSNLRNLTITSGGASPVGGGTVGGVDNPSSMNDTVNVGISGNTSATDVVHGHTFGTLSMSAATTSTNVAAGSIGVPTDGHTHNMQGATATQSINHSHGSGTLSGSGTASFNPRRAQGVIGQLDA